MKRLLWIVPLALLSPPLTSGAAFSQGDYYIRAQHADGAFSGSHEILTIRKAGYHEARYCDRNFWVSSGTVAWTEEQSAAGQTLILEMNHGDEREVICADADKFATLDDLGLKKREVERMRRKSRPADTKANRLRNISDAFKQFK